MATDPGVGGSHLSLTHVQRIVIGLLKFTSHFGHLVPLASLPGHDKMFPRKKRAMYALSVEDTESITGSRFAIYTFPKKCSSSPPE